MTLTPRSILHIPKSNVHRFGQGAWSNTPPVFKALDWHIASSSEAWAIVGSSSSAKSALFQTLLGQHRITPAPPPPYGLYPFLYPSDPYSRIGFVSFSHRARATGGGFVDYSARYGAVRDEDRITLRQSMFPETIPEDFLIKENILPLHAQSAARKLSEEEEQVRREKEERFEKLVEAMGLKGLLELPLIALSNGQTRRARIVKALLSNPALLLLDEPLTGLDAQTRPTVLSLLHDLHASQAPHIIMGLRTQDAVPDWITHLAFINNDAVTTGRKDKVQELIHHHHSSKLDVPNMTTRSSAERPPGPILVDMKNATIKYGPRIVLNNITWQIRAGERWHLQGTNGSGKTTLLSILTGQHPLSYTLPHLHLLHPPRHRRSIPTPYLASQVSLISPELFDAFPRRAGGGGSGKGMKGMTVWEAIGTGFDGVYVPGGEGGVGKGVMREVTSEERQWRIQRVKDVLRGLGPETWVCDGSEPTTDGQTERKRTNESFAEEEFASLPISEQRMVLLMRALVGRAPVVLLDEAWSGMEEGMVDAVRRYLRSPEGVGEDQAVVVITHWEEEVPWRKEDGIRKFRLEGGVGRVVDDE